MLNKILVANRGEIACRIIRTCQEMGIATVAIYSDADRNAQHVEIADEAIYVGGSPAKESYLSIESIIGACLRTSADAIHPGYGFLAENPSFAYAAINEGITFIGPPPGAMEAVGNKRTAKLILHDIPLVPGYIEAEQSDEAFIQAADDIGYPVMVKASAGGGGKGMRRVDIPDDLPEALAACRRESKLAFANDALMLEKVVEWPRHIEVQIFGDHEGHVIALGERECSIQRRHQKVLEESPSSIMTPELRTQISDVAIHIGKQLGYYSAGTVEFLVDDDHNFYFMEVNARLQVEHPVTEMVTGFDFVRWQIEIARGVTLNELLPAGVTAESYQFEPNGHAIEARVYAEDPANDYLPSIGTVALWSQPDFVRTDTGIRSGDEITTYYDPMVAKIISHGTSRLEAIRRLDYGLSKVRLLGVRNNINFLRRVLTHTDHLGGIIHTNFLSEYPELTQDDTQLNPVALIATALAKQSGKTHWRNNPNRPIEHRFVYGDIIHTIHISPRFGDVAYNVSVDATDYEVELFSVSKEEMVLGIDGHRQRVSTVEIDNDMWWVHTNHGTFALRWLSPLPETTPPILTEGTLRAPMPGQIISVHIEPGQTVAKGDLLMIVEAMKMEHRIEAPSSGVIVEVYYQKGDSVQQDEVLLELQQNSD